MSSHNVSLGPASPDPFEDLGARSARLADLIRALAERGYDFVSPGAGTIKWNRAQRGEGPARLSDVFGWSLPFSRPDLPREVFEAADAAGVLAVAGDKLLSLVRVSSVEGAHFVHSAYPPRARDSVFLGPDSYRFARFILEQPRREGPVRILDVGAGAGVGAILAARANPLADVVASDVNPRALEMCAANAQAAGVQVQTLLSPDIAGEGTFDLILANPPFISGTGGRIYRDGGAMSGMEIPLRWGAAGARRLGAGGAMLLYTGSPVRKGRHGFREMLEQRLPRDCRLEFREIDPDIFPGLLGSEGYEDVERIAAIGAVIIRP